MKVAVVHEWLVVKGGAERVLEEILKLFPQADLFCLLDFLPEKERAFIGRRPCRTSFLQKLPGAAKHYRNYLALMPLAIEQFDLSAYDLVISSSYAVAKGVITGPDQLHISYVHSPMRYAWDLQFQYLHQAGLETGLKSWLTRWLLHKMRIWDVRTAHGVDHYIANSAFIARRIKKVYGRSATVIHPPVDTDFFTPDSTIAKEDFYLTISRLVPYKRIDILIQAFKSNPERRLIVIGSGPEAKRLQALAGANVKLLGFQDSATVRDYLRRARAFLFAAEEDFGIVPLEAQACATPVIAYGRGGACETVITPDTHSGQPPTGLFFPEQTPEKVIAALDEFETRMADFTPDACRNNALCFSTDIFQPELKTFIEERYRAFLTYD
ncbi:MAG: glycosyltransferase family 4 protein [Deltaproteobacteria bacterium]|nr:glycosyltransferase family 4 protein [Deltaproteobacteria bacterium]